MTLPREFRRLRVLLLGFGDIAQRLARQQLAKPSSLHGPRLIAVSRSKANTNPELLRALRKQRSAWLAWDLDQRLFVDRLARVGQVSLVFFPPADPQGSVNDTRAQNLARAIRKAPNPMPMVYLSTTGVYGNREGGRVNETTTCRPGQARSRRRLHAEQTLRALNAHVLRVPGIYAHDRLPTARLAAQTPVLAQQEDVYTNHIHAEDLARITWAAAFRGRCARITNAVDETEMTMGEYFDTVAEALKLPKPPRVSMKEMQALAQQGAISAMALSFFSESRKVESARLSKELRITLRYPRVGDCLRELTANTP